ITATSSPRPMAKPMPSCTVWAPKRVTMSSTRTTASAAAGAGWRAILEADALEGDGEERVENDHRHDALHDGVCRGLSDGACVTLDGHAHVAADHGDRQRED